MAPRFAQTPILGAKVLQTGDEGAFHALVTGDLVAGKTIEWLRAHLGEGGDATIRLHAYIRQIAAPTVRLPLDLILLTADDDAAPTLRTYLGVVVPDAWELVVSVSGSADLAGNLAVGVGGAELG